MIGFTMIEKNINGREIGNITTEQPSLDQVITHNNEQYKVTSIYWIFHKLIVERVP